MGKKQTETAGYSLADMQASPVEMEIHGKTIVVNPVPLRDWGTLDRWMREETMRMALRCADSAPASGRASYVRDAVKAASSLSIASPEALKGMLGSFDGMLRLAFLSLRIGGNEAHVVPKGSDFTHATLEALVGNDLHALTAVVTKIVALSFPDPEEEAADPPAPAGGDTSAGN